MPETDSKPDELVFKYWPGFARFIRENHMVAYAQDLLAFSREADLPIMKLIAHLPEEQLLALTIQGHGEFLEKVAQNVLKEHLEESLKKWEENNLEIISNDEIATEDITIGTFIRKKAMLKLLPLYTTDPFEIIELIKEIDIFDTEAITASTKLHFQILKGKIQEQLHFIEKISNTTPGLSYVFDIEKNELKYANQNYLNYFGRTLKEIQDLGEEFSYDTIHPEDTAKTTEIMALVANMGNNDMLTVENRMKNARGTYRWQRHYFSVFKRDHKNIPTQVVGIALDIEHEKRASEQLASREEQLLEAQAIGEIGSFEWVFGNQDLTVVTPQLLKIFGLDSILAFESFMDNVHPADKPKVQAAIDKAIQEHGVYESEYRYIRNNVEKIIWSRGVVTVRNGRPYSMTGTIMDVTERNHIIQRLQRSEDLYKQAQELSHIGNYSYDTTTKKFNWTDEIYRIFGFETESEEINNDKFLSFVHADDREYVNAMVRNVIETKSRAEYRYKIITRAGKTKILNAITEPIMDDNGEVFKIIGTIQDITEKELIEQQIKANEEFIKKIADTAPSIIATYNINTGKYNFVSEGITKLLGYSPETVLREGVSFFLERLHPDDLEEITDKNDSALELANKSTDISQEFKYRVKDINGKYRWLHTYGTVFDRNSEGKVEHVLNISVDITAQVEAEQALQQKNIQLQQSNSSLEDYAYVASHDLKEPLRKISTFSDKLINSQKDQLSEEGQIYLDKIIDSSKRMQAMISDLLAVSTISGNRVFEPYSLQQALSEAVQTLEHKIEEKEVQITVDTLPIANIVPSQFRQLFQNLISNSIKFSKKDVQPVINISGSYVKPEELKGKYNITKAGRYLQITYSDNGIGFDNAYAEKIFSIFQRLHGRTEYEGTGIGLAICRKVAENHGGTIYAKGEQGKGATFTVIIPA